MRILHVIPSVSQTQGGPSFAIRVMADALAKLGMDVDVICTDDDGNGRHLNGVLLNQWTYENGWRLMPFKKQTEFYKASLPMARWLLRNVSNYDVVHIHALFSFSSVAAAWSASLRGVPYVVRPLGVLSRWGFANRRSALKKWSFGLIEAPILRRAASIHYTSAAEQSEAAELMHSDRSEIIPLAVSLEPSGHEDSLLSKHWPQLADRLIILYLSRLDPKKGLETLLQAFARVGDDFPESRLIIAGDGEPNYVRTLRELALNLQINERVIWAGHLSGALKTAAFREATLFVLPSQSENFGIAAVEALAHGLPCVLGEGVAVATEFAKQNACLVVRDDPEFLASGISLLLSSMEQRIDMAARARELADRLYSSEEMGNRLRALYARVISNQRIA